MAATSDCRKLAFLRGARFYLSISMLLKNARPYDALWFEVLVCQTLAKYLVVRGIGLPRCLPVETVGPNGPAHSTPPQADDVVSKPFAPTGNPGGNGQGL